ncbi:hypothetical protein CDAR_53801 [Caerostris darwini]|uniref:Uncharacterized protein n=1 Tax=Caerostris darwini TaxID=1538125 RepID=A0AAV4WZ41_9ARAC|nr:hypothetical protein CDAR_53801 [Caerostris darwini]
MDGCEFLSVVYEGSNFITMESRCLSEIEVEFCGPSTSSRFCRIATKETIADAGHSDIDRQNTLSLSIKCLTAYHSSGSVRIRLIDSLFLPVWSGSIRTDPLLLLSRTNKARARDPSPIHQRPPHRITFLNV